jgi:hypothetical protein
LEVQAGDVLEAVEKHLSLFAETDKSDMNGVRTGSLVGSAKNAGSAKHETGANSACGFRKEIAAAEVG